MQLSENWILRAIVGASEIYRVEIVEGQANQPLTQPILSFVAGLKYDDLPVEVALECTRAFVNAVGCIVGGARHALVVTAYGALSEMFGRPAASILGRSAKADLLNAALFNGLAGAAYSFDDSYSDALLHPGVPLVSALVVLSEQRAIDGKRFVTALAAGMEVACRLTKMLAVPPAQGEMAWSQTGIVGGLSVALACGKLLDLDARRLEWALGIAASEASGTRASHGSMAASMIFGHAAQTGLRAALLAAGGFTASPKPIEHQYGFARLFSSSANGIALVEGLGRRFELLSNTYKPFPCGLVIHPSLDAALQLVNEGKFKSGDVRRVTLAVSPATVTFADRPDPKNDLEAKVSLQHWVAAVFARGKAGIAEGAVDAVNDPEIRRLRSVTHVVQRDAMPNDGADVEIEFHSGVKISASVRECLGSVQKPMSNDQISAKFIDQALLVVGARRAEELVRYCWELASTPDVGHIARLAS